MVLPFVYLDKKDLCTARKWSPSTLYEKIKKGECPPPEKHGVRSLWRSDVVAAWLEEQTRKAQAEGAARAEVAAAKAKRMVSARRELVAA
jgi:predicted DNA-binding transcriptional regulator AlpA